jgi:hypothetical protein
VGRISVHAQFPAIVANLLVHISIHIDIDGQVQGPLRRIGAWLYFICTMIRSCPPVDVTIVVKDIVGIQFVVSRKGLSCTQANLNAIVTIGSEPAFWSINAIFGKTF